MHWGLCYLVLAAVVVPGRVAAFLIPPVSGDETPLSAYFETALPDMMGVLTTQQVPSSVARRTVDLSCQLMRRSAPLRCRMWSPWTLAGAVVPPTVAVLRGGGHGSEPQYDLSRANHHREALEGVLYQIERSYGRGSILKLGRSAVSQACSWAVCG